MACSLSANEMGAVSSGTAPAGVSAAIEIAVVVVCRNALAALRPTLESVLAQQDPRVRLYVVDGASGDGSAAYLRTLADAVAGWVSEPDSGIYDAMNKGWRMAPDRAYVLYLGAGDRLLSLPANANLLDERRQPWPVVLGHCTVGTMEFQSRWGFEMRLRNTAHHQALMIHKAVSPDPPFDTGLRIYADWDFNLRLMRFGLRGRKVGGFHSFAEPGGASWIHDLHEIRRVARRHGGRLAELASVALNRASLFRRRHRGAS